MRYYGTTLGFLVGVLMGWGCTTDGIYDRALEVGDVHTLKNGIAIHESGEDAIYYLDGNLKKPRLKEIYTPESGEKIIWSVPGPEQEAATQLFVMTAPLDERDTNLDERLFRVTTDGKNPTAFKVGTLFDQIAFGPSGQFAILYHGAQDASQPGLYNSNEVSLIDLTRSPSATNPRSLNVSMDGRRIDMVTFVPSLQIGGVERQLVVFLGGSVVRVIDLADPENTWVKVPLLPKTDNTAIVPLQVIAMDETPGCSDASCEAKIFIRASGTEDVYYITLGRNANSFEGTQSKQLEAGGYPSDMEIVHDGDTVLLVVLSPWGTGAKVNVIDIDTSEPFSMIIEDHLTSMLLQEDGETEKLVFYGNNASGVHFLTIEALTEEKGKNLSEFVVQGGASSVLPLDASRLLIIPYGDQGLVLLDLVEEKAVILSASGAYDWTRAQIHGDIFYLVPETRDRVDYLDLATGRPSALLLDDYTESLHLAVGRNTGIAFHGTASGRVTLFPLNDPSRGKAKVVDGLWLKGLLDEKGVE